MLLFVELAPLFKIILILVVLFVALIVFAGGMFFFLIGTLKGVQAEKNEWEASAEKLGLEIDTGSNWPVVRPMEGFYKDYRVRVETKRITRPGRVHPSEEFTFCEVFLPEKLSFPFEVKSESPILQTLAKAVRNPDVEIGIPGFDKSFYIDCPNEKAISELLTVHLPENRTPNLAAELLLVKKSHSGVRIEEDKVYLRKEDILMDPSEITELLDAGIELVKRVESACRELEKY